MLKKGTLIGLILIVLMLMAVAPVFAGGGGQQHGATGANPLLSGRNIKVASWWATYDVNTYEARNEAEEKDLEYRKRILRENNFRMSIEELADWDNYFPMVTNNIMAGNKEYSVYELPAEWAMTLYRQGLLFPVSTATSVNMRNREVVAGHGGKPQYNQLVEDLFTFNGRQYGWQYGLPNNSWGTPFVFFNKRLLSEAGINPESIYDHQKNNTWTWDVFRDMLRRTTRDLNNDGIIDIHGLPADDAREVLNAFVYGNGANYITIDAQGRFHNATGTPAFAEALNFYNQLHDQGYMKPRPHGDVAWDWEWTEFFDSRVAFVIAAEWRKGQALEMTDDYGYVLPPRGPRSTHFRIGAGDNVYVVPNIFTLDEVNSIMLAMEKWNTPMEADWLSGHYWASRSRRDVDETVVMSRDARYLAFRNFNLVPGFPHADMAGDFRDNRGNPAQFVERWSAQINALVADMNR